MKGYVFIPIALVAGLVLGGWGPRQEVRRLKGELELARTPPARGGAGVAALGALGQILPVTAESRSRPEPTAKPDTAPKTDDSTPHVAHKPEPPFQGPDEETIRAGIDAAMDAWKMRSDLVRNTFVANNALRPAEAAQFDTLVAAMNLRLKTEIQRFADQIRAEETMTTEDGLRLMNQLSSHVLQAYDDMDKSMPASWRAASGPEFSMADLVDPSVAEPLMGLEDRMAPMRRRPSWRNHP